MRFFKGKPLREKILAILLLILLSFFTFIDISKYFSLNNAIINGNSSRVKLLLKLGFDANGKKDQIAPPIYFAVSNDNAELLELLLSHGANINAKNKDGKTALEIAIMLNRKSTAKLLVEKGAQLNDCSLYWAAFNGNTELVESLIKKGLNVNAPCHHEGLKVIAGDEFFLTPLHSAIGRDSADTVEILLNHGAPVNSLRNQYSPLHAAASNGAYKTVRLLISKGAKVDATDENGHTPLYYATKHEDIDVQQILIAAGAIRK